MKITQSSSVGLIAAHAALTTGVHGVTGTICGLSDTQTLTNKTIGAGGLTFLNVGVGDNPVITSNAADQRFTLTGHITATGWVQAEQDVAFKSSTGYYGTLAHAITAARTWTFPDVTGTVCLWNAANAAVTRYLALGCADLIQLLTAVLASNWSWDTTNLWVESTTVANSWLPVKLPHGAVVTALRVTGQETGSGAIEVSLERQVHATGVVTQMAVVALTSSMAETADTSIDNATIDNDTYTYAIYVKHETAADECRLRAIQIDYTVTVPQP